MHPRRYSNFADRPSPAFRILAILTLLGLSLSACRKDEKPRPDSSTLAKSFRIAVVPRSGDDPLWPIMEAGIRRQNAQYEERRVVFEGRVPSWYTPQSQRELLATLQKEDLRGLVIFPSDAQLCREPLAALARSGVVVVTLQNTVASDGISGHVGERPEDVGARMGDLAAERAKSMGTIGLIYSSNDEARRLAFEARLRDYSWAEILVRVDISGHPAQARDRFRSALERYPRTRLWVSLAGWPVRLDDQTPLASLPGDVKLLATDPYPLQWSQIESNQILGSVGVDYPQLIERAFRLCRSMCEGQIVDLTHYTLPVHVVESRNLTEWIDRWNGWTTSPDGL